jgi:hypothetical protein
MHCIEFVSSLSRYDDVEVDVSVTGTFSIRIAVHELYVPFDLVVVGRSHADVVSCTESIELVDDVWYHRCTSHRGVCCLTLLEFDIFEKGVYAELGLW